MKFMTQEDKELLLLKDLCSRLPYGVKIELTWWVMGEGTCINTTLEPDHIEQLLNDEDGNIEVKPYLRPMSSMTEEEKAKAYDEALKKASAAHKDEDRHLKATLERIFPELKEDDDERIKKELIQWVDEFPDIIWRGHYKKDIFDWIGKQGEPNPYSGVSFKYNGHTWGMCARDGGVEILVDGEIQESIKFVHI